jgi:hypothetical protein
MGAQLVCLEERNEPLNGRSPVGDCNVILAAVRRSLDRFKIKGIVLQRSDDVLAELPENRFAHVVFVTVKG